MNPAKKSTDYQHFDIKASPRIEGLRAALKAQHLGMRLALFIGVSFLVISATLSFAATNQASLQPSFQANLTNSLIPSIAAVGSKTPTFTRATTATFTDWEGIVRPVLSGEARFQGARRVRNLIQDSGNLSGTGWSAYGGNGAITSGVTAPDGTATAFTVTANSGGGGIIAGPAVSVSTSDTATVSAWLKVSSGTLAIQFGAGQGNDTTITLTTTWQKFSWTQPFNQGSRVMNIFEPFGAAFSFQIWHPQSEDVTGQSNQNPSEYVSVGVLPAPFHGAGVDGVQYFNTLNGNAVDPTTHVVTEATGAAITSATAKFAQGFVVGSNITTPDTTKTAFPGDIDIRAWVAPTAWNGAAEQMIISQAKSSNPWGPVFALTTAAKLELYFSISSSIKNPVSSVAVPFANGTAGYVRVTRASGSGDTYFYTSSDGATWTQLGTVVSSTAGVIDDSPENIMVGAYDTVGNAPFFGRIYRAQIYNGIGGTLAVDFNPNTYSSGTTWRSTTGETWTVNGNASVFTGSGLWDATGPLGYLAEGSRTNLALYSQSISNWGATSALIPTDNQYTAPDGTVTATSIRATAASLPHYVELINGTWATSAHTYSLFVKYVNNRWMSIYTFDGTAVPGASFDVLNGVKGSVTAGVTSTMTAYPNGWYLISATIPSFAATSRRIYIGVDNADSGGTQLSWGAAGTETVAVWGAQLENNSFPSSYIPTTSASVARNADVLTYPSAGNFNTAAGTTYADVASTEWTSRSDDAEILILDYAHFNLVSLGRRGAQSAAFFYDGNNTTIGPALSASSAVTKVALAYSGSAGHLYVNGVTGGSTAFTAFLTAGTSFGVGAHPTDANSWYGTLRNVKIWKKALTDLQLTTLTSTNLNTSRAAVPASTLKTAPTNNGLVGYWPLDEGSGTAARDTSGSGNTGSLVNSPSWITGKLGKALSFNGSTSYVDVGNASTFNFTTTFSTSAWVNLNTLGNYQRIISKFGGAELPWIVTLNPSNYIEFQLRPGIITRTSASALTTNRWYHVVTVYNGTTGTQDIYINGILNDGSISGAVPASINVNTSDVLIGSAVTSPYPINGSLDDVRLYNRALSATEIANLYALGASKVNAPTNNSLTSGLVGLWSFDGKDVNWGTNQALDRSGSGNNGTLTNMSTTTSPALGKIGQALNFNGTSYVNVTNYNLPDMASGTLAAWVNPSTLTPGSNGCNSHNGTGNCMAIFFSDNYGYFFAINSDGALILDLANGSSWIVVDNTAAGKVSAGSWQHIAVTVSGTTVVYYVNGVAVQTNTVAANAGLKLGSNNRLGIGGSALGAAPYLRFAGKIDDVRIYNRALSPAEVKQLYNLGR